MNEDLHELLWDCQHEARRLAHAMPGDDGLGFQVFANAFLDARVALKGAADRIEALEADVIRWQAHGYAADYRSIGLEMEVERLRETLKAAQHYIRAIPTQPIGSFKLIDASIEAALTNQTEKGE